MGILQLEAMNLLVRLQRQHFTIATVFLAGQVVPPSTNVVRLRQYPQPRSEIRGVAMGWTGVDMSTPLLPEVVPEIDANPLSFYSRGGVGGGGHGLELEE